MAYVESHQQIGRHPKTRRAARLLGVSVPTIIGHLHLFWHWCLDYAKDGDVTHADAADIADAALWSGEAADLFGALLQSGFIDEHDGRLYVHDWGEYGGKLEAEKQRKRKNQADWRNRNKQGVEVTDGSNHNVTTTLPSRNRNITGYIREEERREEEKREECVHAPESTSNTKYPQAPSIESPLAKEIRRICKKTTMFLGATDVERLQECLMVLEGEKATMEQVQEFGRKCGQHWISRDSQTKLPRAPSFKQIQSHWHEVLELPEPAETVTGEDLDALAAQFAKPQE